MLKYYLIGFILGFIFGISFYIVVSTIGYIFVDKRDPNEPRYFLKINQKSFDLMETKRRAFIKIIRINNNQEYNSWKDIINKK